MRAPPSIGAFNQCLSQHLCLERTWPNVGQQACYIFTDGSVRQPTNPLLRLAGWAWTFAAGPMDYQLMVAWSLRISPRTGPNHSELSAIIDAISFGITRNTLLVLFCDNWNVVRKVSSLLRGQLVIHALMPDHDLWTQLQHMVLGRSQQLQIIHVYSHQNLGNLDGVEHWACQGNAFVDRVAHDSFTHFDQGLLAAHQKACEEFSHWAQ